MYIQEVSVFLFPRLYILYKLLLPCSYKGIFKILHFYQFLPLLISMHFYFVIGLKATMHLRRLLLI